VRRSWAALPKREGHSLRQAAVASLAAVAASESGGAVCPLGEADALELLLRLRYVAPHYVSDDALKGRVIFSGAFVPKGAVFCEYGGQLVCEAEALEREATYTVEGQAGGTGCYSYFFKHPRTGAVHCVDATAERKEYGVGRLLSHSRAHPNLSCRCVVVDGVPRLVLISREDILYGDELRFDYGERDKNAIKAFQWLGH